MSLQLYYIKYREDWEGEKGDRGKRRKGEKEETEGGFARERRGKGGRMKGAWFERYIVKCPAA